MASFSTAIKRVTPPTKRHPLVSFSTASQPPPSDDPVISTAASILKHHRSKSRWTELRSLFPTGFRPSQFSKITLQLRNNPRLALSFFQFTLTHSMCDHSLLSYSTIIHTLSRARLKSQTLTLIQSALIKFPDNLPSCPPKLFEVLVKTYRTCDSAPFVFDLLIEACLQSKRIDQSVEIVRMLGSQGIYPTISTCNSLIRSVSKSRGCYAGYDMYREVFGFKGESGSGTGNGGKVAVPNAHTFNVLMLAFFQDGLMENVEEVWGEMGRVNCEPNSYSYSVLMAAYCENERMEEALKVWEQMGDKGLKHVAAYNTIIGGFCKSGEVGRAEGLFGEMGLRGVESSCLTFEHLITGYCEIGDVDSALLLYEDMCRKGFWPEGSTIDVVIWGLCEKKRISEALELVRVATKKRDIMLKEESYECLIKGLCQESKMEEALMLQAEMVGKSYMPNSAIYESFIDGYKKQGNVELAGKLREEMLKNQKPLESN
ncbi:hypothetical protein RJ639_045099 [Escallonia herrerae]|uniref:Pentatricopeptide repeat-containing protein n=1 Tax=Escallonia herrerae TaxID=1293975 RepID=A0AA88W6J9_9ASTE|nr:hypothetical protein RJ639_045099 [Escallonia herrerae]